MHHFASKFVSSLEITKVLKLVNEFLSSFFSLLSVFSFGGTGFHQCKWGYRNVTELKHVVKNFKKAHIPLDTIWNDIDYMQNYLDFTTHSERYPEDELKDFIEDLHDNGQHYVLILDPGIPVL